MSKAPSFSPIRYNPTKRVERLYFPQPGDTRLYNQCGRRHFQLQTAFKTPYASYTGEETNGHVKSRQSDNRMLQPLKAPSQHRQYESIDLAKRRPQLSQRNQVNYAHKEQLQQQMESFNVKRELYKKLGQQQLWRENERQNRMKRVKTENAAHYPEDQPIPNRQLPSTINIQESVKDRIKTEYEYAPMSKQKMRFNPTFLSSINY